MRPRECESCGRTLGDAEPYWRFAVALEGDQDDLSAGEGGRPAHESLERLLDELEGRDAESLEAEVHESFAGVLCGSCRARLRTFLRRPAVTAEPH